MDLRSETERSASRPRRERAWFSSSTVMKPSPFLSNKSKMRWRRRAFRLGLRSLKDDDDCYGEFQFNFILILSLFFGKGFAMKV